MRIRKAIKDLQPGDKCDLCEDPIADPDGDDAGFEFEYAVVEFLEKETDACTVVHFTDSSAVGFPPDHVVNVER